MVTINEILARDSVNALRYLLNGYVLDDFQTVDALVAVTRKVAILSHDTGMGKTLIASAIMRMLKNEDERRKFLFVCKVSQLIQTPKDISDATGMSVCVITSKKKDLETYMYTGYFTNYDIIIVAEEVFSDPSAIYALRMTAPLFCAIFIDEAHEMTNFKESDRAAMLKALMPYYEYRYALTATPMTTSLDQFSSLLYMLEPDNFSSSISTLTRYIEKGGFLNDYPGLYIRRTRNDIGVPNVYKNNIVAVEPTEEQVGAEGSDMFVKTKGPGAVNQVKALVDIIEKEKGFKGLVYIRRHKTREWVEQALTHAGIKYACINGKTTQKRRSLYQQQFNDGELDVLITSVTTSLNFACDYVIFYEFTVDARQFIGRSERGLISKEIRLYYIFTKYTGEADYFLRNIYERSLILRNVLQRDYSMLIRVAREVEKC